MKNLKYKVRIKGLKTPAGSIPISALNKICESIVEGSGRALRLSIEGVSLHRGKLPPWQKRATEFTITGITKGSTILEVEAPILRDVIPEQIAQQNLWYTGPQPNDTAISVLARAVSDVVSRKVESDQYDKGVLDTLLSLRPVFSDYATECEITAVNQPKDKFSLSAEVLDQITEIKTEIPEPQAVVVSGLFDLIEHSHGKFKLEVADGHKISGVVDLSAIDLEQMRSLWGKKVTIKGTGHFTSSGKARFIEAHIVKEFEKEEKLFEKIPRKQSTAFLFAEFQIPAQTQTKSPLAKLWGKWPGDEPIDELLKTLKDISMENL